MLTIISATNRPNSKTLKFANHYKQEFANKGVDAQILSLEHLPVDVLNSDMYGKRSAAFTKIQDLISATDKFMFIMPEYNGSYPGVLKVLIDACNFPDSFFEKKAALTGVSSGKYGNIRGVDHFTGVCHYINLHVMPLRLHIPNIVTELDAEGKLCKEDTLSFIRDQVQRFIKF